MPNELQRIRRLALRTFAAKMFPIITNQDKTIPIITNYRVPAAVQQTSSSVHEPDWTWGQKKEPGGRYLVCDQDLPTQVSNTCRRGMSCMKVLCEKNHR